MENIIKKIFDNRLDEEVHSEFIKFGRGEFKDKYLIEAKKQKKNYSIKTSYEFANYFVKRGLKKSKSNISIKGIIVTTNDIKDECKFEIEKIKNYMGMKQIVLNTNVDPNKIEELMEKFPRAFFTLSFKLDDFELKIKAKAPKSAKPSAKGELNPKANFCSLKTSDNEIIEDLFFDFPDFNDIKIKHDLIINEIIIPEGITDAKEIREKAKKKGKIIRTVIVDGKEIKKEREFFN